MFFVYKICDKFAERGVKSWIPTKCTCSMVDVVDELANEGRYKLEVPNEQAAKCDSEWICGYMWGSTVARVRVLTGPPDGSRQQSLVSVRTPAGLTQHCCLGGWSGRLPQPHVLPGAQLLSAGAVMGMGALLGENHPRQVDKTCAAAGINRAEWDAQQVWICFSTIHKFLLFLQFKLVPSTLAETFLTCRIKLNSI